MDRGSFYFGAVIGFVLGMWMCFTIFTFRPSSNTKEYREGQIDYANGRIEYSLKKQLDGSTRWEKKNH